MKRHTETGVLFHWALLGLVVCLDLLQGSGQQSWTNLAPKVAELEDGKAWIFCCFFFFFFLNFRKNVFEPKRGYTWKQDFTRLRQNASTAWIFLDGANEPLNKLASPGAVLYVDYLCKAITAFCLSFPPLLWVVVKIILVRKGR